MTLVARHAALSDIGLHRSTNEDAFVAEPPLFAVADGMGGAQAGEVASHLALDALAAALSVDAALPEAALAANERVYRHSRSERAHSGMGTTLTAALLRDDRLEFVHVGDSRLYLWRAATLEQVTNDHSLVGEMVREGHLTREAALAHPQRSILSRALGTEARVQIDSGAVELRAGDAVVLCSDGLYSMVSETTIAAVLRTVDDPLRVARQLVREAKNEGGHDNITVVVLRFGAPDVGAGEASGVTAATAAPPLADDQETTAVLPATDATAATAELPLIGAEATTGEPPALAAPATGAEPSAPAAPAAEAGASGGAPQPATAPAAATPARRPRRRQLWLTVALVVVLLAVCLLAGAVAADRVYFVGDHAGMVSVYHGLPWQVGGFKLYGLYLETTTPVAVVAPAMRARVERHDLHRKAVALELVRKAQQGLP